MKGLLCTRGLLGSLFVASLVACQGSPVGVEEELFEVRSGGGGEEGNCDADLRVKLDTDPESVDKEKLPCPSACFDVKADKNITHIFVDTGGAKDFKVLVDGEKVDPDKFHDQGGPCNHGEHEIEREIWFPLTGNQERAEVCVLIKDGKDGYGTEHSYGDGHATKIKVGAKSACECRDAKVEVECEKEPCPPCPVCDRHSEEEHEKCLFEKCLLNEHVRSEHGECECKCPCEEY